MLFTINITVAFFMFLMFLPLISLLVEAFVKICINSCASAATFALVVMFNVHPRYFRYLYYAIAIIPRY